MFHYLIGLGDYENFVIFLYFLLRQYIKKPNEIISQAENARLVNKIDINHNCVLSRTIISKPTLSKTFKSSLSYFFAFRIQCRCRIIKQQNLWISNNSTSESDSLLLSHTQFNPFLSDDGLKFLKIS